MVRRGRLDAELVRRRLAENREHAAELIAAGAVRLGATVASNPATGVTPADPLRVEVRDLETGYASRGGGKLAPALERFAALDPPLQVQGRRCLDAGASTGGFTDVLLRAGAARVIAVDVGYGQLDWALRSDERVEVRDRTNVRTLGASDIGGPVELTVADLSFIRLATVLPALAACTAPDGDLVVLVKPQFELPRRQVDDGGVVRDPALWAAAIGAVVDAAQSLGLVVRDLSRSDLPGPKGNVEFLLWLSAAGPAADSAALIARETELASAVAQP